MNVQDDSTLIRQILAGSEPALAALYNRYTDPLFAFIYHHLPDLRPEAEEVWQETWLAALNALPAYSGRSRFFTWLCGIARHKLADYYRRCRRTQTLPLDPPGEVDVLAELVDEGPLPEEIVLRQANRTRVVAVLAMLPEDYRAALAARYADGQSVPEVARLLGKSYKATESVLTRARVAFRAALNRLEVEDEQTRRGK